MARVTRASKLKASPPESPAKVGATPSKSTTASKADTPIKSVEGTDESAIHRRKQQLARRQRFKKKQIQLALEGLKEVPKDQRKAARADIYGKRTSRIGGSKAVTELQKTILKQQEEIEELKKLVSDSKSPEAASDGTARTAGGGRGGLRARKTTSA